MNHRMVLLCALLAHASLSTAQSTLLLPFRVASPAFHEASEAKIAITAMPVTSGHGASTPKLNPAVDLAFSPLRHLSLGASFHSVNHSTIEHGWFFHSYVGGSAKGYTIEGFIGTYGNFGKYGHAELLLVYGNGVSQKHGKLVFAGPGQSDVENYFGKYQSLAIQPAVGLSSRYLSLKSGVQYRVRKYHEFTMAGIAQDYMKEGHIGIITGFINVEVGNEYLRFTVQGGASGQASGTALAGDNSSGIYVSLGIVSHFAPRHSVWYGNED